jgi:hypothetical protein
MYIYMQDGGIIHNIHKNHMNLPDRKKEAPGINVYMFIYV